MKRKLLILCVVAFGLGQTILAQRETTEQNPPLVYQKDKRPVSDKRLIKQTEKLFDPNDKTKAIDFKIENVDVAGLEIVKEELDAKYQTLLIVVENKGVRESGESFLALVIKAMRKVIVNNFGFTSTKTVVEDVYWEGKGVPKLKPNEQIKIWFDLTKSKVKFGDKEGLFSNKPLMPNIGAKYWIETVMVSEPISVN